MDNVLVSVVMANYKTQLDYLKEAIDSILNQTFRNFELIIIDDCSQDESLTYIQRLCDPRVKLVINERNMGLTKSLNKGLKLAAGKYIARMDSDDISCLNRIERQVSYMEKHPDTVVCGTWFEKFGVENIVRKPVIDDNDMYRCQLLFSNTPVTMCHPSVMMRVSVLKEYRIKYNEEIKKAQDYALWVECSRHGNMAILPEVLVRYRTHEKQISLDKKDEQYYYADLISRMQLQELGIAFREEEKRWRYDSVKTQREYLQFFSWISEIKEANKIRKLVNPEALEKYTDNKLKNAIKRLPFREQVRILFFTEKKSRSLLRSLTYHSIAKRIGHEKS